MTRTTRTPRARAVGAALRALRQEKDLSARETGRRIGVHQTIIGRIEGGTKVLRTEQLMQLLGALEASPDQTSQIRSLAHDMDRPNWHVSGAHLPNQLETLIMYEREATSITEACLTLVPGLLQTGSYARSVIHSWRPNADDLVLTRLGRSEVLDDTDEPRLLAILDEAVLRRVVGGPEVMARQCRKLVRDVEAGRADIRVLPETVGVHAAISGAFTLWEFADATPIAHLEHMAHGSFIDDPSDVEPFVSARSSLLAAAMNPADSVDRIAAAADHHARNEAS